MGAADHAVEERNDASTDQPGNVTKVGIRDLGRNPSEVIARLIETGGSVIVTNRGRAVAVLTPVSEAEVEDFILTHAEEYVRGREEADRNLAAGRTKPLSTVLAELDA
jgi:prevent-host-death family protein